MEAFAGMGIVIGLFFLIVGILWLLVPFLIMGTNGRIDRLLKLVAAQRELQNEKTHVRCPYCRELARKEATKCPHCTSSLTASP